MASKAEFQAAASEINADATAKLNAARAASGAERVALLDEADRLIERAKGLNRLALGLAAGQLAEIVGELQTMAEEERQRGSSIVGAIEALVRSTRRSVGLPADGPGATAAGGGPAATPATDGGVVPTPVSPAPATPASPPIEAPAPQPAPRPTQPAVSTIDVRAVDADVTKLHPVVQIKLQAIQSDLAAASVPMRVFEAYRAPERQRHLFRQGREDPGAVVTAADAWGSYHQYGMSVDMVIDAPNVNPWEDKTEQTRAWWDSYHDIARKHGLEPLSFEKPHIQLADTSIGRLRDGQFPAGADDRWRAVVRAAATRFPDGAPPLDAGTSERPPLHVSSRLAGLTPVRVTHWASVGDGIEWRVDGNGVYLRQNPNAPLRTPGAPNTCIRILELFGDAIHAASLRHRVPPELIAMTIATETAAFAAQDFSGPDTFRWESHVKVGETGDPAIDGIDTGDYSAGPMQVLATTARWINRVAGLGHDAAAAFPHFKRKPRPPSSLGLYDPAIAIDVGTAYIARNARSTTLDPIKVAAAYNAGSLKRSAVSVWGLHAHGNHLDRAARWFGDACDAMRLFGR